jgi:c(7)-type cytochrome triheme protein
LFFAVSCSDETLSLFFDIQPKTEQEKAAEAAAKKAEARAAQPVAPAVAEEEGERPDIEAILDWEQASELLPKDDIDEVDWMAALREGIIRPRAEPGRYGDPEAKIFGLNFFFPGEDPSTDAYFPHTSHTEWLTCASCHPAIFRYRDNEITMDSIFEGEYCAKCHGVVAFAVDSCNRCHFDM